VYYNYPSLEFAKISADDDGESINDFNDLLPKIKDKAVVVHTGDVINVDEVRIEILYHYDENDKTYDFVYKTINDASIAFRVDTPDSSVIFLGDLGPEAGEVLVERGEEKLRAEYCQMAHHGHGGVGADVYILINPRVCMWNAPDWLWEETGELQDYRRYGLGRTRLWMERLGVKEHIVTKDGTAEVEL
jgi:hypothetical protein